MNWPAGFSDRIESAWSQAASALADARVEAGHWTGELASSALSTATAVAALAIVRRSRSHSTAEPRFQASIESGLRWLADHANPDGGWGDTVLSRSNLSTTTLGWAAFGVAAPSAASHADTVIRAEAWIRQGAGGLEPDRLAPAIIARYGKDRTFSVPILTMCALSGRLGPGSEAWRHVLQLPFELAACPQAWFAALRLPVVSYALPALIAIGIARHQHRPSRNPVQRWLRELLMARCLRVLTAIQPANGGFLEATPLTSFVTMSLAGSGLADHAVVAKGTAFLVSSQRPDGSWAIDTNLATWATTLSVNALANDLDPLQGGEMAILEWLLRQQYVTTHPYTQAEPGGWAWTDLPGGVPDADDTAGAVLALRALELARRAAAGKQPNASANPTGHSHSVQATTIQREGQASVPPGLGAEDRVRQAALAGIHWLLKLQNRDGGIPTFCRGWGALPFDRSSPDLTAHALRAWLAWRDAAPGAWRDDAQPASLRALSFLERSQRADGSWVPLWFGNQHAKDELNPTYGTARVLLALTDWIGSANVDPDPIQGGVVLSRKLAGPAVAWLAGAQNSDGGWGGAAGTPSSVEETSLAIEALAAAGGAGVEGGLPAMELGLGWLLERVESGRWREAAPIGFYFARLWYFERLYPLIFSVAALGQCRRLRPGCSSPL